MRNSVWITLAGVIFAVGVVSGVLWQAYVPLLGRQSENPPGQQSKGTDNLATLSGSLSSVVHSAGDVDVYYERPFVSPPALTFVKQEKGLFNFEVIEQRADGFKIHVSAISAAEYPRWEAKGRPAAE